MAKPEKRAIQKALREAREWRALRPGFRAYIMYDKRDGKIWADCHLDEQSYSVFGSPDIVQVPVGDLGGLDGPSIVDNILGWLKESQPKEGEKDDEEI